MADKITRGKSQPKGKSGEAPTKNKLHEIKGKVKRTAKLSSSANVTNKKPEPGINVRTEGGFGDNARNSEVQQVNRDPERSRE